MKIPKRFQLKDKRWTVVRVKILQSDDGILCDGLCDCETRTIYLQSGMSRRRTEETFLHELFHAVLHEAHVNPYTRLSNGVEDVICDAFADLMLNRFTTPKWKRTK